jgi:hypothetical protein
MLILKTLTEARTATGSPASEQTSADVLRAKAALSALQRLLVTGWVAASG